MKQYLINIQGIIITEEEYEKIKFNCDEVIRINITVKRNKEGESGIFLGEVESEQNRVIMKEGLFFDVKYTKIITEKEIWESREELMEYHEQQEQEKCRKCREEKL